MPFKVYFQPVEFHHGEFFEPKGQRSLVSNPLIRKLSAFINLSASDQARLDELCACTQVFKAGSDLIKEGDRPDDVFLLLQGWAYRYKIMADGKRQILAYLIPGDLGDIHAFILKTMDHALGLLSDAKIARVPQAVMLETMTTHPAIGQALWWATLVDEAVLREWLVNVGQRSAYARLAHLFCEMWLRMHQVGLTDGDEFSLPLTQEQLGDTVGLTSIHVNRTLQRMRAEGLISLSDKQLTIHDGARMREIAGFDPNYLHLDRRG